MADQNSNDVSITGGNIQVDSLAVTGGKDGQLLIGRTSDHKFTPAYLTAGLGVSIATGPSTIIISQDNNLTKNYGSFQDLGTAQTAAANTAVQLRINTVDFTHGVTKASGSNQVYITNAGVYSIIISLQLSNDAANYDDFTIWPAINGVNQPGSASVIAVPVKKGSKNGHTILTVQYTFPFNAGQYFEFFWHNNDGNVSILTFPASTVAPIHPSAAAVILSVIQVA